MQLFGDRFAKLPGGQDAAQARAAIEARAHAEARGKAVLTAAAGGDLKTVRTLLAGGTDVNAQRDDGETALYAAAASGVDFDACPPVLE